MLNYTEQIERMRGFTDYFGFDPTLVIQTSQDWHKLRKGVFTASKAKEFCMGKKTLGFRNYLNSVIAEMITDELPETINSRSLAWGREYEEVAAQCYEFTTGQEINTIPFIMSDNLLFGCSPDLMLLDGKGVEIKCPFDSAVHVDFLFFGNIKEEWIKQVQFSMWVTGATSWDFCTYDPRVTKGQKLHIVTFEPDKSMFETFDERAYDVAQTLIELDKEVEILTDKQKKAFKTLL